MAQQRTFFSCVMRGPRTPQTSDSPEDQVYTKNKDGRIPVHENEKVGAALRAHMYI